MAKKENHSLFSEACTHKAMVLVSPKLLKSKGFQQVLDNMQFQNCILFMAVDEAHLLNSWGETFWKAFEQIGWIQAQLPMQVQIFATTATLQPNEPTENIIK